MVVGRAEYKIEDAAKAFSFDFRGKIVMDIGSSTGGFTEYALNRGAKIVIAVEKGTRQMKAPLRFDSRVELHEKTDIFEFWTRVKNSTIDDPYAITYNNSRQITAFSKYTSFHFCYIVRNNY